MVKGLRIVIGLLLTGLLLYGATWATRDCVAGLYSFDNCLWLSVRAHLGLPPSKILRAAALELVGLTLLAGLYLTVRYVLPIRGRNRAPHAEGSAPPPDSDSEQKRPPLDTRQF